MLIWIVRLPDNAVFGIEAILEGLAVLVGGVVTEHFAACRALEGLEACLALDGESGGVLQEDISTLVHTDVAFHYRSSSHKIHTDFSWLFASPLPPLPAARSRFCCALRSGQHICSGPSALEKMLTSLRYP